MFALEPRDVLRRVLFAIALAGVGLAAQAAAPTVPYVPTPPEVVERMLEMAKVGPGDYVIDLGSGDGRIVIAAAKKHGARGFGVDLNPERIGEANENARKAGVTDRVAFLQRDLMETDLADATVITLYLLPRVNLQLRPRLLELKPGTRVVSHDFSMDDWKADEKVDMTVPAKYGGEPGQSIIYFWIIPAKVAGRWQWELPIGGKPQKYEAALDQAFQSVSGSATVGGRRAKLEKANLRGDEINMTFDANVNGDTVRHELNGRVSGNTIVGTVRVSGARVQGQYEWGATRLPGAAQPAAAGGR